MESKLWRSGANACCRTTGNPLRSPIASRIVFSLGGVKAMTTEGRNTAIAAIIHINDERRACCRAGFAKRQPGRLLAESGWKPDLQCEIAAIVNTRLNAREAVSLTSRGWAADSPEAFKLCDSPFPGWIGQFRARC